MASPSLSGWRGYSVARGDEAPMAVTDSLAQAALLRAIDYVSATYPRAFAQAPEDAVNAAVYIAAKSELSSPGFWIKIQSASDAKVLTEVAGIKWTPIPGSSSSIAPRSTMIDALLLPYDNPPFRGPAVYVV